MKKTINKILLCFSFALLISSSGYSQVVSNPPVPSNVFVLSGIFNDTVAHVVWENPSDPAVNYMSVERSYDGNIFSVVSSAYVNSLIDIHTSGYNPSFNYFNNILLSSEHGNARYIYNDVAPGTDLNLVQTWYRVSFTTTDGRKYISPVVQSYGKENKIKNLKTQPDTSQINTVVDANCPSVGTPPTGYITCGSTIQTAGQCCYYIEQPYVSSTPVEVTCGGNSYAWCCDNVPDSYGCLISTGCTGYAEDPCCVHACTDYYSCSCTPWQCCTNANVSVMVVIQSTVMPAITLTANVQDETCTGMNDGAIYLTVNNATSPISYIWSNNATSQNLTNIPGGSYSVTVTDANNCQVIGTYTVNSNPSITVDAGPDVTICNGESTTLTATGGGVTYNWSNSMTGSSITVSPTATTIYTVTAYSAIGCSAVDNVTVNVQVVYPNAGTDQIICYGQSANLTAFGGVSYYWSNTYTTQSINVSPAITTLYTVTVTDALGCTAADDVQVTVNNLPPANAGPDQSICFGTSTSLSASGGTYYEWSPSTGLSASDIANPTANPVTTTTYTVTVTDGNGCTAVDNMVLTVNPLPTANAGPDQTICIGSSANISASGGVTYNWYPATGLNFSNIPDPVAAPNDTTTYIVTVTDVNGCTDDDDITINVNLIPTSTFTVISPTCVGFNSTITYTGTASAGAQYNWDFDGGTVVSGSGQGPYLVTWNFPATYFISLTVTENNCTSPVTTVQQIIGQVTATLAITDSISCFGSSDGEVTVTAVGQPNYTYAWSNSQNGMTATGLDANIPYIVTVTDSYGCTTSQTITLTQPQPLTMNFGAIDVSCYNGNDGQAIAQIFGGTTSYQYSWTAPGVGNVSSVTTLHAGTYTLSVTDYHGCSIDTTFTINEPPLLTYTFATDSVNCFSGNDGSILITPSGGTSPYGYTWNPSVSNGPVASGLSSGTYYVTITDHNGCDTTAIIPVEQPPQIILNTSGDVTICIGQSTTISASATGGTGAYTYTWDNGLGVGNSFNVDPVTTTTYSVSVSDANGCAGTPQSLTVTVNPPITVDIFANPSSICLGESAQLTATANGGNGNYTYTWGAGIGVSSSTITVTPTQTTMYPVTVTDNCGSPPGIDSIQVIVYPLPVVLFTSDTISGCEPLLVNFTDLSTPAIGSWLWDFGDPASGSNNTSILQNPSHLYSEAGIYTVTLTVTTTNGCSGSYTHQDMIEVFITPIANFTMHPPSGSTEDPTISFIDLSSDAYQWYWDFGEPSSSSNNSSETNPQHSFESAGTFTVTLIVESIYGCTDTTWQDVFIKQEFTIYVPNAFTPNSDGDNDGFSAEGTGIDLNNFEMYIYDRWGELVFQTNDFYEAWDGRVMHSDEVAPIAVYSWIIYVKDLNGEPYSFIGRVTLVR